MDGLFLRVLTLSVTCSVAILPLLLLGKTLGRRYAAKSLSLLWLLLAVRLLVPVELNLPAPVSVPLPRYTLTRPADQVPPEVPNPSGVEVTVATELDLSAMLPALWLMGGAGFLLYQGAAYLLARRALLRGSRKGARVHGVPVVYAPRAETAMTLGVLRPVLVLPQGDMEDLDLILGHELCHLRRRDTAYKALLLLCNAVHWFNPLVWLMTRAAGENLELCCDEEVLRGADETQRRRYGEVLLRAAAGGRAPVLSTRFGSTKGRVKERIMNLYQEKRRGALLVVVLVVLVVGLGLLVAFRPAEVPQLPAALPSVTLPTPTPAQTDSPGALENDSAANFAAVLEAPMGVDFPQIDYVSSRFLVFHDYWGLAVFDFLQGQVVRLLDTPSLGMNLIQGDQFTQVKVSGGLEQIYLYNTPGESAAYLYLLEGDRVQEVPLDQAQGAETAAFDPAGTFTFPEGAESQMKHLVYQAPDGTEWQVFTTEEQWLWPLEESYQISQSYGHRVHPITGRESDHSGLDIRAEQGALVLAAQSGTVTQTGFDDVLGEFVEVDHNSGIVTRYAALKSAEVVQGDLVEKGQTIGLVGSTGASTGSHLHLAFFNAEGAAQDPMQFYDHLKERLIYR